MANAEHVTLLQDQTKALLVLGQNTQVLFQSLPKAAGSAAERLSKAAGSAAERPPKAAGSAAERLPEACRDFQLGRCKRGERCKFSHNNSQPQEQTLRNKIFLRSSREIQSTIQDTKT